MVSEDISEESKIEKPNLDIIMTTEDGMRTAIPSIGRINIIKLMLSNGECIFLVTDLEKENAIETYEGTVLTQFGETKGRICPVVLKERGEWLNYDKHGGKAYIYTLLSNPYLARRNVRIDKIDGDKSDNEILNSMLAYDYSQAIEYRDKWLLERTLKEQAEERANNKVASVIYTASEIGTDLYKMRSSGLNEMAKQLDKEAFGFTFGSATKWLKTHKFYVFIAAAIIGVFLLTYFGVI